MPNGSQKPTDPPTEPRHQDPVKVSTDDELGAMKAISEAFEKVESDPAAKARVMAWTKGVYG